MAETKDTAIRRKLEKIFKSREARNTPSFILLVEALVNDEKLFKYFYEDDDIKKIVRAIQIIMTIAPDITPDQWDALQSRSRVKIQTQCALALIHQYRQPQPKTRPKLIEKIPSGPITHVMHSFGP